MNKTFDALLQFNECAVVSDAKNASFHVCTDWISFGGIEPWIRRELLETE